MYLLVRAPPPESRQPLAGDVSRCRSPRSSFVFVSGRVVSYRAAWRRLEGRENKNIFYRAGLALGRRTPPGVLGRLPLPLSTVSVEARAAFVTWSQCRAGIDLAKHSIGLLAIQPVSAHTQSLKLIPPLASTSRQRLFERCVRTRGPAQRKSSQQRPPASASSSLPAPQSSAQQLIFNHG